MPRSSAAGHFTIIFFNKFSLFPPLPKGGGRIKKLIKEEVNPYDESF